METVRLSCHEINGENGCFIPVGNRVVILYADVPVDIGKWQRKCFIIYNVANVDKFLDARYYAEKYLEYCYCGMVENVSIKP